MTKTVDALHQLFRSVHRKLLLRQFSSNSSRLNINLTLYLIAANGERLLTDKHQWQHIRTLLKLAEMGAHRRTAKISTEYLAEKLGISQQTASRHLIGLERKRWIHRTITPEGSLIKIDSAGMQEIQKLYSQPAAGRA